MFMLPFPAYFSFSRFFVLLSKPLYKITPIYSFCTLTQLSPKTMKKKTFSHIFQQCSKQRLLDIGKQAHCNMIVSGFQPTLFVTNCLIDMYIKCSNFCYASKVFDHMLERDVVSWNAMIYGYSSCGDMDSAHLVFNLMPERDVVSWNSLISGYLQNGDRLKPIELFRKMMDESVVSDRATLAVVLKSCSELENYDFGTQVHGVAVKRGLNYDVVTGSALVNMYGKCKCLQDSARLFQVTPEKNLVTWGAIIAAYVQNDQFLGGLQLFKEMQKAGVGVSQSIYASIFRSCGGLSALQFGSQVHAHALKANFGSDIIVGTATLDMYAKCDSLPSAHKVFNSLPDHNLQSFNAIVVAYARNDQGNKALQLFRALRRSTLGFDEITLSGALSACSAKQGLAEGLQVHALAIKSKLGTNTCVTNAILDMYGKCGALLEARCVFDAMTERDAVSWNAIIAAHAQNENEEDTLSLFVSMLRSRMEPDEFTYGSVVKACASQHCLSYSMEIHSRIIKSGMGFDIFVGSALVDMYAKCEMMEEAEKLHYRIGEEAVVSWNAIISGYSLQKESEEAQKLFLQMLEMGVKPDNFTYATVLDTCADLAAVGLGKQIHAQIIKKKMQSDVYICSTLVDMYSKCGNMLDSRLMFEKAPDRDFVAWNALICGLAHHGLAEEALTIFESMQRGGVKPNHATFIAILRACAHIGLVDRGLYYFHAMINDYNVAPRLDHYSCMVDILARSGHVSKALEIIHDMPFEADAIMWRTLLSSCKIHGNVEVAEKAASEILKLEPQDSSAYVLLSNVYADAGMWDEVSKMRKVMRQNRLKKEPGCSWIEVKSAVHAFLVADTSHLESKEIYETLDLLIYEMKRTGYVPDTGSGFDHEEAEQHEHSDYLRVCMYSG